MLELLSSYRPFKKRIFALEHSKQDQGATILGLELVQKKDELDIEQTFAVNQPSELDELVKTSIPLSLVITDDQILSKKVANTGTDTEVLREAFPNLNLNDFYYEILRTSTTSFISVCRKQYVENLISTYQKASLKIASVYLGSLKMNALSQYANDDKLYSNNSDVSFVNNEINTISKNSSHTTEQYNIDGLNLSSEHMLPLAVALDEVLNTETISGNVTSRNVELYKDFKEASFFKNALQIGVGFLLITLLINFFVFNTKYKKLQGLQDELQVYTTQQKQIESKQSEVNIKDALVQSILATGFSKSSYYVDQIIQKLPETAVLSSFVYQPLGKPIRKDKNIDLKSNMISVTGTSSDKEQFTSWLRTVEKLPFVDTVTIIQYGEDKKNNSDFEIMLTITSDGTTN